MDVIFADSMSTHSATAKSIELDFKPVEGAKLFVANESYHWEEGKARGKSVDRILDEISVRNIPNVMRI